MELLPISGRIPLGGIDPNIFDNLTAEPAVIEEPGFIIVHMDNRSLGKDAWFDNVQVLNYQGEVSEENHYYPFGLTLSSNAAGNEQPLKYQTKELERKFGLEMYDFHARQYDPQLGRFNSIDSLAEKFASMSPFTGMANHPINAIDPDGKEVKMTFNRPAQRLEIIDMDQYNSKLPTLYVTATEYKAGGIRNDKGELTNNQVLVVNNVFSGGISEDGNVERNSNQSKQKAIAEGDYEVVDNDADTKHLGWYRLDKQDSKYYNDKEDATGRDGFRFHLGRESWGCVTVNTAAKDRTQEWSVVQSIFNTTSTTTVKDQRGN